MLTRLNDDLVTAVLERLDEEAIVRFACCSSAAANAVRANRAYILARWRAGWDEGRARVLAGSRALFPDNETENRKVRDNQHAVLSRHMQAWDSVFSQDEKRDAIVHERVFDFHFGNSRRTIDRSNETMVLTALWFPVTAVEVQLIIGGKHVIRLTGAVIRALAPDGAKDVDVLPMTIGSGFPIHLLNYHGVEVMANGPCRVRATFKSLPRYVWMTYRGMCDCPMTYLATPLSDVAPILPDNGWHVLEPSTNMVEAVIVVLEPAPGKFVDAEDALETVSVRNMAGDERTWDASLLRARRWRRRDGVWQGLQHGFLLPVVTTHNDVKLRLTLRPGVAPDAVRATFVLVEYNRLRVLSGMAGLRYLV